MLDDTLCKYMQDAGRTLVLAVDYKATIEEVLALAHAKEEEAQCGSVYGDFLAHDAAAFDCGGDENDDGNAGGYAPANAVSRYLHYGGVPLRPQRALYEYGIQNHATLELTTRLRGGCFGVSITLWIIIFICCLVSICTCGLSLGVAACLLPFALLLPLCCL